MKRRWEDEKTCTYLPFQLPAPGFAPASVVLIALLFGGARGKLAHTRVARYTGKAAGISATENIALSWERARSLEVTLGRGAFGGGSDGGSAFAFIAPLSTTGKQSRDKA